MPFDEWKIAVGEELAKIFGWNRDAGLKYIEATDDGQNWREMYDDDLTPDDAAGEEALAMY